MNKFNVIIDKISNIELNGFQRLIVAICIIFLFFFIRKLLTYILIRIFKHNKEDIKLTAFYKPLNIFFIIFGIYIAFIILKPAENLILIANKIFRIAIIMLFTYAIFNAINPNSKFLKNFLKKTSNVKVLNVICISIKVIIFCIALIIIISELGYDITGVITSLGLFGLTFSLAAQDTAKNLFGGIVIFFDKPFLIGDWIQTDKYEGIVEEITFRSTRIRTWDDSVATIPNSEISNCAIVNWTKMNLRRTIMTLILELNTKPKQILNLSKDIENLLKNDNNIENSSIIVRLTQIVDSGYELYICYKSKITNYIGYMEFKEKINYKIIELLEKNKIELAYPTQSIYIKK